MSDEKMYDSKLQMAANELHRLKAKGYDAQPLTDAEKSVEIINLQDEILKQDSQIASLTTRLAQAEHERDRLKAELQAANECDADYRKSMKQCEAANRALEAQLEAARQERDELKKQMEIDQHTRAYQVLVDAVPKAGIASVTGHAARIVVAELAAVTKQLEAARGEVAREVAKARSERWKEDDERIALLTSTLTRAQAEGTALVLENRELRAWKESALQVMNQTDYQKVGEALGVRWGDSVGDKILPGILALQAEVQALRRGQGTLQKKLDVARRKLGEQAARDGANRRFYNAEVARLEIELRKAHEEIDLLRGPEWGNIPISKGETDR